MMMPGVEVPATDPAWPSGAMLLDEGRALAPTWQVTPRAFLKSGNVACEADYKRTMAAGGEIMQHAQLGYRDFEKSRRAFAEIYESCRGQGVTVDRYGICLDWSMAVPRAHRAQAQTGTGLILSDVDDFVSLGEAAPVATHFGDFVLGFPAALENTQAALAAGSTAIGNLGQYFTFRAPGFADDVMATSATLRALGLIAAQDREILVHSNLDDGFASQFSDLASCLGAVLLEQDIVDRLCGCTISHCYGHHFTDPERRMAFHYALAWVSKQPGTMVYGNTMSYRGSPAENHASLACYLTTDILGQTFHPSGHAINPVPVTENHRIPDIDEIIDAQCFAHRLVEETAGLSKLVNTDNAETLASQIVAGGRLFFRNVQAGLAGAGVDIEDPFQMLITLRRIGGHALEAAFGPGMMVDERHAKRQFVVRASLGDEIESVAHAALARVDEGDRKTLEQGGLRVLTASTDVHAHGKMALDTFLATLGVTVLDGGMTADPVALAAAAAEMRADAIAISTYNGIALEFATTVKAALRTGSTEAASIPVFIGGRLNQIPESSNTSLPVNVETELAEAGCVICPRIEDIVPSLLAQVIRLPQ